eukprot:TRINITY_DN1097_c0_g1_i1.p2 TRINITY_DN1097_c0_g1~~TRINITY_DN1097_c0_g1_i1.p2  ORF type:complete len:229 (+),score=7.22 TRINITY_DN1097_c0_g1_i1:314-1000(+)
MGTKKPSKVQRCAGPRLTSITLFSYKSSWLQNATIPGTFSWQRQTDNTTLRRNDVSTYVISSLQSESEHHYSLARTSFRGCYLTRKSQQSCFDGGKVENGRVKNRKYFVFAQISRSQAREFRGDWVLVRKSVYQLRSCERSKCGVSFAFVGVGYKNRIATEDKKQTLMNRILQALQYLYQNAQEGKVYQYYYTKQGNKLQEVSESEKFVDKKMLQQIIDFTLAHKAEQ